MTTQMTERFSAPGATLVKLFGRPDRGGRRVRRRGPSGCATSACARRWRPRSSCTALTLVSALALALGLRPRRLPGARRASSTPGTVVTLALLLTRLYAPLTALASARVDVMSALVSFERVFEVLDLEPLIAERRDAGTRARRPGVGRVRRRALRATRRPTRCRWPRWRRSPRSTTAAASEVLHGVSFRVEPGQMVALVGSSGAGKSTIASLVPRLYDVDERRRPARRRRRARPDVRRDPRHASAWSPRTATCSTSRSGPTCARPRPTRPTTSCGTRSAAPASPTSSPSLPDGLDTVVGERGYRLSGGERQRLTIARLLLARPRVVILDEATAHLDSTSEAAVQEALAEALAGRTAHRHRPPAVDDPGGRPDPRGRGRPDRRARHARRAAGRRRPLRRAVPHPVRRRGHRG